MNLNCIHLKTSREFDFIFIFPTWLAHVRLHTNMHTVSNVVFFFRNKLHEKCNIQSSFFNLWGQLNNKPLHVGILFILLLHIIIKLSKTYWTLPFSVVQLKEASFNVESRGKKYSSLKVLVKFGGIWLESVIECNSRLLMMLIVLVCFTLHKTRLRQLYDPFTSLKPLDLCYSCYMYLNANPA